MSGNRDPVRFQVRVEEMKLYLKGLTPPRPQEAPSADSTEQVRSTIEQVAVAVSQQSAGTGQRASVDQGSPGRGLNSGLSGQSSSPSGGPGSQGNGQGNGNGLALSQGKGNWVGGGIGNGVAFRRRNGAASVRRWHSHERDRK